MPSTWLRNAVAEAIGTFALVFVAVLVVATGSGPTPTAMANGLIIVVFVAALGHVSGGHFNPAITLGMYLGKKIDIQGAATYWAAQLVGSLVAALIVLMTTERDAVAAGTPVIASGVGVAAAIVVEAVATFFLVLVVFGTVVDDRSPISVYPFAIGLTVSAGVFAIGPLTGGALNPARGFGPAVVGGGWGGVAAWLIGPLLGAALAWAVYQYVLAPTPEVADDEGAARP